MPRETSVSLPPPPPLPGHTSRRAAAPPSVVAPASQVPAVDDTEDANDIEYATTRRVAPWAIVASALVHLSFVLILAATYILKDPPAPPVEPLRMDLVSDAEAEQLAQPFEPIELPTELPESPPPENQPDISQLAQANPDESVAATADRLLFGNGTGRGTGLGQGSVQFFGEAAAGNSFVFVIDCSGSMSGRRFERAIGELTQSLGQLDGWQSFSVIFFNGSAIPYTLRDNEVKLLPADQQFLPAAMQWIRQRRAAGSTVPDQALMQALALRSDVVFFLTDADRIPRNVRVFVKELNTHQATVHTICFGNSRAEPLMQGIAADNHGRYRFVP